MSIKVFYNPRQQVNDNTSFSPSAGKPAKVASQYIANFDVEMVESFKPLTKALIALAHDTTYVHEVLSLKRANGFGNTKKSVADSLTWTTGSFVAAAMSAYKNKTATCSLTSGFHHACFNGGGGFCTFNGLVIAAQVLRLKYGVKKVGIIDFDEHYGNGTEDIKEKLKLNYIEHYTLGNLGVTSANADEWLDTLEDFLTRKFAGSSIILYQAGADCWHKDPLGGRFTKSQLSQRDEIVFRVAKKLKIPVAFNLAGGYSEEFGHVLDIHNNTMAVCSHIMDSNEGALKSLHIDDERPKAKAQR